MGNQNLSDSAWNEILTSTISGSEWNKRIQNGYKGKPYNWQNTAFGRAKIYLDQIVDCPIITPTPPVALFGKLIPKPAFTITGAEMVVRSYSELQTALAKVGLSRVIRLEGMIPVPVNTTIMLPDTRIFGLDRTKDGIDGGRFLANADRVHFDTFRVKNSLHDGIKLADGKPVSDIIIDNLWISDVGDQGILSGGSVSTRIWVRGCKIERVGLTPYPGIADGHCIYTGGPTSHWTIIKNDLRPKAFAVQLYPNPSDILVSQNTMFGGDVRGGLTAYTAKRMRSVGNIVARSKTGAFEIGNSVTESMVDDCMVWECVQGIWTTGYKQLPGGNVIVGDPLFVDANAGDLHLQAGSPARGFVRESMWDYVTSTTAGCND